MNECYVKDYNLYYSLDGNEWIKICPKTFLPKTCINSDWSVYQTEVVEFDEISLKFFKFEVTSSNYVQGLIHHHEKRIIQWLILIKLNYMD